MYDASPVFLSRMNALLGVVLILLCVPAVTFAQTYTVDTSNNISRSMGDDLSPAWSPDGNKILYQSNRNGNWDIFMYDMVLDTTVQITYDTINEQNPGWYPDSDLIYFDAGRGEKRYLYKLNPETGVSSPVFTRKISCKDASFTPDGRMMYFLGYEDRTKKWELFSYHFIYDNLNQLTDNKQNILFLDISTDAKSVLYGYETYPYPYQRLRIINWYGEHQEEFNKYNISVAVWHPVGLKIYFVSDKDNLSAEIYSIWRDGTHLKRLTESNRKIKELAVAPDGSTVACAVSINGNYEIIIISPEVY